jgi:glycosyltransferase involved in cell wall biosynthesis
MALPRSAALIWRAVSGAEIVHSGVIGWPLPLGWLGIVFGKLQGKFVVAMVESAPWRLAPGTRHSLKRRVRELVFERINRGLLAMCDLAFFTQEDYRTTLMRAAPGKGHVINASWIDEGALLPEDEVRRDWTAKALPVTRLRILFAGRLVEEKGVRVLLDCVTMLRAKGAEVDVDVLGDGPLRADCDAAAVRSNGGTRLNVLGTLRYGSDLFALLRTYHALIVPSLTDEQPRIVYDAYACGIPVLVSDTAGLRSCVTHEHTGYLHPVGDAQALADRVEWLSGNRTTLVKMGLAARQVASHSTHRAMHARRAMILEDALRGRGGRQ